MDNTNTNPAEEEVKGQQQNEAVESGRAPTLNPDEETKGEGEEAEERFETNWDMEV